jgi:NAD(P)-dependent dehydrogenase (short-subunit alcohol dehydrogenase family)
LLLQQPGGLMVEVTDGTAAYNATHYRLSVFYDLAKNAAIRMAWDHAKDLEKHGATAVAITPGWMRSEMMLGHYNVTEASWRDAIKTQPHFAISETPRFTGRAVAALAADPDKARWWRCRKPEKQRIRPDIAKPNKGLETIDFAHTIAVLGLLV